MSDGCRAITFQGRDFILTGGGAIATADDYQAGLCSYAHLYDDGTIKRFGQVIGHRDDLSIGEEVDVTIGLDALPGLFGESWR